MDTNERHRRDEVSGDGANGATGGAGSNPLSQQGQRLLAAGDAAINKALSENSAQFLKESEQVGGQ